MSSYKQGEVLSILYDIWISGTKIELEKKACINSIEVKETVEGADSATIVISDPKFLFIEDNIFLEDNTVKIQLGWSNTTYRVNFDGYISAVDINFSSSGVPTLSITCMDNTHKMNREKKKNTYSNCTSADVVKDIVKNYGFQCVIDSDYAFDRQETITQSDQTDIDFITKLAKDEVYPFTARLIGDTFYYVKMGKLQTPAMELTYRKFPHEIIDFSPQINKETKKIEINKYELDTGSKSVTSTEGTVDSGSGSASSTETSPTSSDNTVYDPPKTTYTYNPATKTWKKNG